MKLEFNGPLGGVFEGLWGTVGVEGGLREKGAGTGDGTRTPRNPNSKPCWGCGVWLYGSSGPPIPRSNASLLILCYGILLFREARPDGANIHTSFTQTSPLFGNGTNKIGETIPPSMKNS